GTSSREMSRCPRSMSRARSGARRLRSRSRRSTSASGTCSFSAMGSSIRSPKRSRTSASGSASPVSACGRSSSTGCGVSRISARCRWPRRRSRRLFGAKVVREAWRGEAKLAERARLELPDALAGHPHGSAGLGERARRAAVQAEAESHDAPEPRLERSERLNKVLRACLVGRQLERRGGTDVLEQVAVQALAVADGRLEAERRLDELEKLV